MRRRHLRRGPNQRGFTLIEIIVVISIISLLVVAFMPAITEALGRGEETETQTRMLALQTAVLAFENEHGFYPPDDFVDPPGAPIGVKAKSDPLNSGIESLVIFLSWSRNGGTDLTDHEDWLANTDSDQNDVEIPRLERRDKVEVVDAWGTPFAYFTNQHYAKPQQIALGGEAQGERTQVRAYKNPASSGYLAPRKFQIISAGPDWVFNTDDDLVIPPLPRDDE